MCVETFRPENFTLSAITIVEAEDAEAVGMYA